MLPHQTISITVTGKVQGVFYRQSTKEKAQALGITGIVRNLPDGGVHIVASGEAGQLNEFIAWCKQGPPRAAVNDVQIEEIEPTAFKGFTVQR